MVSEQQRLGSKETPFLTERQGKEDFSSDSSIEAFVDKGVHNAFTVSEKTMKENFHPFAISSLLSMSPQQ